MPVEQSLDVGKKDQQRRPEERGHEGREPVVVAEGRPQFLDAHRVVLVDDRDGTVVEQGAERVADVEVAGPVLEIIGHEEHLPDVAAAAAQRPFVGLDQAALADRRNRLQPGQFLRAAGEPHPPHAGPHGPRTDEHDLPAAREDGVELAAEGLDPGGVEQAVGSGEHAGADLHDDHPCRGDELVTQGVGHRGNHGRGGARPGDFGITSRNPTRSAVGVTTGTGAEIRRPAGAC